MLTVLWLAGIVSGFMFPSFLINAIRAKDEDNEVPKNTLLACLTFGICLLAVSVTAAYS